MPQDMDIALLRSFAAVAESGRMTQAAKSLHLTQSAVSQRIKRLEDQLGLALFERRADAAHLTRDGERFLGRARRLIVFHDEMLREMRGGDFAGEVRFGVPHDVVGTIMPAILGKFHKLHPNVLVTLVSETTAVLCKLLNERAIEFSLTTERERAAGTDCLFTDHLVWVGARGGTAARARPLSVALGRDNCGFRTSAVNALNKAGLPWRPICQVGSMEPVFATLEADMAVAPFLACTIPKRLVVLRTPQLPALPSFHVNLRYPAGHLSNAAEELIRLIRADFAARKNTAPDRRPKARRQRGG